MATATPVQQPQAAQGGARSADARTTLGIDPGVTGAAVWIDVDGSTALVAWVWTERKRRSGTVIALTVHAAGAEPLTHALPGLHCVGERIAGAIGDRPFVLSCEGLFVPRPPRVGPDDDARALRTYTGRVARLMRLVSSAALVCGPLLDRAASTHRPRASTWRPDVLGIPAFTLSDAAENAAREALEGPGPLVVGLASLAGNGHLAEAAMIAVWGSRADRAAQAV